MPKTSKRILIAEDDKAASKVLVMELQKSGFEAVLTENGAEALKALAEGRYDLLLLDIVMPNTDGFSVLERLKKDGSSVPVIVLSNLGDSNDEKRAMGLGAKAFLVKADTPIKNIIAKIESILK